MGRGSKVQKIIVSGYGNLLSMDKGQIILKDMKGNRTTYPLSENMIDEVVVTSGNLISTGLLTYLGFWDIPLTVCTKLGRPISVLHDVEDDSRVFTRVAQYQSLDNGKSLKIAKNIIIGKIESENNLLLSYGLEPEYNAINLVKNLEETNLSILRKRLLSIEGKHSEFYFKQVFDLFPKSIRPDKRIGYKAYGGINNALNLGYKVLFWKVWLSIIRSHLEPYMGYVHTISYGKPALVVDMMEIYRSFIDNYVIKFCKDMSPKDLVAVEDDITRTKSKRMYLKASRSYEFTNKILEYFTTMVKIPRKNVGVRQEFESLLNEECMQLAKYVRNEIPSWNPRIVLPSGKA